jgi:two-component system sensor histidine kinase KdpD
VLAAIAMVALMTLVAWSLNVDLTVAVLLLLVTVILAAFLGLVAAVAAATAAFLSLNWFFTPPTGSFAMDRSDDIVALVVFAATAILLGVTVQRLGVLATSARRGEREARLRLDLTNRLLEGDSSTDALASTVSTLRDVFGFEACALRINERVVATGELPRPPDVSVVVRNARLDATSDHELSPGDRALLEALVAGLATAADRLRLQDEVRNARLFAEIGRQRAGFLSAVSHNLRTPLTAVKAAAGTLLASWSRIEPEERRELLETIADEAERLERLVRNTLELSRIRAGALQVEHEPVEITDLVRHAVRRLRPIARAHRVRLDVDDDLPAVWLDVAMIEQILLNLLENALRFAPPGSEILVGAHLVEGNRVEVRVSDHGPGVPAGARDQIFEEFQSLDPRPASRNGPGTGLGLAIVRALVIAHGGSVRYEDTTGGGATFVCTFPLEPA